MSDQADKPSEPLQPVKPPTLGTLIRHLREVAGLTRSELETQINVSVTTLRRIEDGRQPITADVLQRLLAHPAMAQLPAQAAAEGVAIDLERGSAK